MSQHRAPREPTPCGRPPALSTRLKRRKPPLHSICGGCLRCFTPIPILLHNIIFILNAGHETTTNLVGNGLYALLEWPEEKARLIARPELIRSAVEEMLRFESPNQLGNRLTTQDVEIEGVRIPAGTYLTIGIGAANRDPAELTEPDRLDIAREPNRHLAFGSGPHVCAGLNVARLEGRIAIGRFLARFPHYALAGPPVRGGRARFRGFLSIPVALGPVALGPVALG